MTIAMTAPETGRALLFATRPFAIECKTRSWWYALSTLVLLLAALTGAALLPWWPLRTAMSLLGAGFMVRAFIIYHDYMHGAILRGSRAAAVVFRAYAAFSLTPVRSWRNSHDFHHAHNSQISFAGIGAFPLVTVKMWREASLLQRIAYRVGRHPLIIVFGYVTVFFFSICLQPLLQNPRRYWDSAVALAVHGGLIASLWALGGFDHAFFAMLLPMTLASIVGSYLFFSQHSFKGMNVAMEKEWSFYRAALETSSFTITGRVMQWITGNIGFHHVHHLNIGIPFYRLPEAMAAIPALQEPVSLSMRPRDILNCFRASLWDEDRQRMVSYREARSP